MKLQSKLLGGRFGKGSQAGAQGQAAAALAGAGSSDAADGSSGVPLTPAMGANLRSLGSELQQAAIQSTFDYSRNWTIVIKTVSALLIVLSVAHAAVTFIPLARGEGGPMAALLSWNMLGLALEIAVAGTVAAVLLNLLPAVQITPQGLGVSEVLGWRTIPWNQIGVLRVMELGGRLSKGRYVVMVPFTGSTSSRTPAPMLKWIPALFGAAREGERGVMLTSDIKHFDRLLQLIVTYLVQAGGGNSSNVVVESFVDEQVTMNSAQLLLDPEAALERLSRYTIAPETTDPYGVTTEDTDPPVNWRRIMLRQLPLAVLPALALMIEVLARDGDKPFLGTHIVWAVMLLAVGLVELPFIAYLIQVVGELMVGGGKFKRAVWAYADLQLPRAIGITLGLALMSVGAPAGLQQALWFAGLAVTTLLTIRFVQKLYYMPVTHTILAAIGTFIFQMLVLVLYFGVK